jgi:hypothetical protein
MGEFLTHGRRKVYVLDDKEKKKADALFKERPDIMWIVQQLWNDVSIDGRSAQGKAVTEYLSSNGKQHKTTKF